MGRPRRTRGAKPPAEKYPVATWVDEDVKQRIVHRWAWLGLRSEAAYVRQLIEYDLSTAILPSEKRWNPTASTESTRSTE